MGVHHLTHTSHQQQTLLQQASQPHTMTKQTPQQNYQKYCHQVTVQYTETKEGLLVRQSNSSIANFVAVYVVIICLVSLLESPKKQRIISNHNKVLLQFCYSCDILVAINAIMPYKI